MYNFEQSNLWKKSVGLIEEQHQAQLDRFRASYRYARERAAELVSLIPQDCKGLTVHDVSHLDALWEMADLVCGADYPLNPAEGYVLGCAILLHDAGMSVASFPKGMSEISNTVEWKDIASRILRNKSIEPTSELVAHPPAELVSHILFTTLRALHAKHAESLADTIWPNARGDQMRVIEDGELRSAFGSSIGRIAHRR